MGSIRIGICDRHTLIRVGLEQILASEGDIEVTWSVSSLAETPADAAEPEILLVDFTDPSNQLLNEVSLYQSQHGTTRIVAMTDHGRETCVLFKDEPFALGPLQAKTCCIQQAFMMGARGAVRKTCTREELIRVIRAVSNGQVAAAEPTLSLLLSRLFGRSKPEAPRPHLTERELDVIRGLALGKSNKEIGVVLGIREQTVKNHISHILGKLELEDRLQIVVFAARHRIVSLDQF